MNLATNHPGDAGLVERLKASLNQDMLAAAEPLIQKALQDAEKEMRRRLAASLIAHIDSRVTFERSGPELIVTIRREPAP